MPPLARRRRRTIVRRVAASQSAIVSLRANLAAIDNHVASIRRPVHAVKDLIGQIKAPLQFPADLHQDLTDLQRLLSSLRTSVVPVSLLPGPIGPAARALRQGLEVLAGPPRSGSLGRTRDVAGQIDRTLKPLRDRIEKIEKPVENAAEKIDALEASVAYLRDVVDRVIARYGTQPPADVDACAGKLNKPIAALREALDEAAARIAPFFAEVASALARALAVLKPIGDVVRTVQKILAVFRGRAMRSIMSVINRFSNGIKPYVNKVEFIVRRAIDSVLRKLGINAGTFTKYLRKVAAALDPLKPVERAVNAALAKVKAFIAKLVDVSPIVGLLEALEDLRRQLALAVDAFLRSPCKALLDPERARTRASQV